MPFAGPLGDNLCVQVDRTVSNDNAGSGYYRKYQDNITVGRRTEQAHGSACRMPDGSWRVSN